MQAHPISTLLELLWKSLPHALLLFWGLASGAALVALLPLPRLEAFRNAVLLSACRGKMWEDRPRNALGQFTDWRVPQGWFAHFYDVGVTATGLTAYIALSHYGISQGPLLMSLVLLSVHLARRCLETHFMMKYPAGASMHLIAYIFGLVYYIALPLTCLPSRIFQEPVLQVWLAEDGMDTRAHPFILPNAKQKLGALIFLAGNVLQHHSHAILARLSKREKEGAPAQDTAEHYCLPSASVSPIHREQVRPEHCHEGLVTTGGAFELVANLLLASGPTHKWYQRKFEDYPKSRRAVIPFVY